MPGKVKELKEKDFSKTVKKGISLIDFWAPWCHGCKAIAPHLDDLAKNYNDDILFYKVNVIDNPELSSKYGVMSLPNILIFKNGKIINQIIGTTNKQKLEAVIKKALK